MADLEDLQASLLEEYSKTIDSSTVLAILSDYNLSNFSELEAARLLLTALSSEVVADEAANFDPSGASGSGLLADDRGSAGKENESVSARSEQEWRSQTDDTSLSQEVSVLDFEGLEFSNNDAVTTREESPENFYNNELDGLDEEGKEKALVAIFSALKPFDVKWTLKKCNWDSNLALDELMTQSFLEESGSRHRGVDAFSQNELPSRPRKGKAKKRQSQRTDDGVGIAGPKSPVQNEWDRAKQEVDFIARNTGMPTHQVSFIYHKNGASTPKTIAAIIEAEGSLKTDSEDPIIQINAFGLQQDFPSISTSDLEILVQITHPSINSARELAKALISPPVANESPIQLEFRTAPIDLGTRPVRPRIPNGVHNEGSKASAELASAYIQARDRAFIQAHAAYRKGKSDPLMAGAAAYYSQVGRDHDARARIAESAAADAFVSTQSSLTELDLHGVNVTDAVRISREKVTTWWHEGAEGKIGGRAVSTGYRIVTGMGNHSEGKRGKLGPAVGKMLIREGWKVEVGSGVLLVTGIAKKR